MINGCTPTECQVNSARIEDWMSHCRQQHEELNRMLHEIHAALYGNGHEGLKERVKAHSQRIDALAKDIESLEGDVDNRITSIHNDIKAFETRLWKVSIVIVAVVVTLGRALSAVDFRTILGL